MSSPEVRLLELRDLDRLLRLYAQLQPEDSDVSRSTLEQTWHTILAASWLPHVGVFSDAALVATCHAVIVPNLTRGARPYAIIEGVVTDAAQRRRGFGALAMRSLIERCWRAGCYKIQLASGFKRGPAHDFYRALGFDGDRKRAFVLTREL